MKKRAVIFIAQQQQRNRKQYYEKKSLFGELVFTDGLLFNACFCGQRRYEPFIHSCKQKGTEEPREENIAFYHKEPQKQSRERDQDFADYTRERLEEKAGINSITTPL